MSIKIKNVYLLAMTQLRGLFFYFMLYNLLFYRNCPTSIQLRKRFALHFIYVIIPCQLSVDPKLLSQTSVIFLTVIFIHNNNT